MAQIQEDRAVSKGDEPARLREPRSRIERLVIIVKRRRRLLRRIGLAASLVIIAISATIFVRTLLHIDVAKFERALAATGDDQIALAFGFTALSYLALTGYDAI